MNQYFAIQQNDADGSIHLATNTVNGQIVLFDTVLEAEQGAANIVPGLTIRVYDASKFEVPVPLVAPGTPMLVNGQWVVSK